MSETDKALEQAAEEYGPNKSVPHGKRDEPAWVYAIEDFKAGATWMRDHLASSALEFDEEAIEDYVNRDHNHSLLSTARFQFDRDRLALAARDQRISKLEEMREILIKGNRDYLNEIERANSQNENLRSALAAKDDMIKLAREHKLYSHRQEVERLRSALTRLMEAVEFYSCEHDSECDIIYNDSKTNQCSCDYPNRAIKALNEARAMVGEDGN